MVFVKQVAWKGNLVGHKVYEISSVKFISLNVGKIKTRQLTLRTKTLTTSTISLVKSSR